MCSIVYSTGNLLAYNINTKSRRKSIQVRTGVSMSLFVSADTHQGSECFSFESRGKQCAFMSVSAILTAENTPLLEWSQSTLTRVLLQGDNMYIKAPNNRLIDLGPGVELLSINNLPKLVDAPCGMGMFSFKLFDTTVSYYKESSAVHTECQTPHSISDSNDVVPIAVRENDELPVMVDKNTTLPVMVDENIELPVMVDKTIELPVMVDNNIELPVTVDKKH